LLPQSQVQDSTVFEIAIDEVNDDVIFVIQEESPGDQPVYHPSIRTAIPVKNDIEIPITIESRLEIRSSLRINNPPVVANLIQREAVDGHPMFVNHP
jgi:hypothetical protein